MRSTDQGYSTQSRYTGTSIVLGVFPSLILPWMEPHVTGLVDSLMQAKM